MSSGGDDDDDDVGILSFGERRKQENKKSKVVSEGSRKGGSWASLAWTWTCDYIFSGLFLFFSPSFFLAIESGSGAGGLNRVAS